MRRYVCPFSYCGRRCWTAWGVKRHVTAHMERLFGHMDRRKAAHFAREEPTDG